MGPINESTKVAPLIIRWINRSPGVIFAISWIAKAMGWMNKLMVSLIISIEIRGLRVRWGKKCARDDFILYQKHVITALLTVDSYT
jgi:hypothetical protein